MNEFLKIEDLQLPGTNFQKFNEAYGDSFIAAKYCGFNKTPKPTDGEWQHGWIIPERNIHPEFVIGSDGLSITRKNKKYFVARKDQEEYLFKQGFTNVKVSCERTGSLRILPSTAWFWRSIARAASLFVGS